MTYGEVGNDVPLARRLATTCVDVRGIGLLRETIGFRRSILPSDGSGRRCEWIQRPSGSGVLVNRENEVWQEATTYRRAAFASFSSGVVSIFSS